MGVPVEQVAFKSTDAFTRSSFESMLMDVIAEENPQTGADFAEYVRDVAPGVDPMSDKGLGLYGDYLVTLRNDYEPGDSQYQEAYARFNQMNNAGPLTGKIPGPVGDFLGAVSRQWTPFAVLSQVDSQAEILANNKTKQTADGKPRLPGQESYDYGIQESTTLTDEARTRRASMTYTGKPPDTVGTARGRAITETYSQIKYGYVPTGTSVTANGKTYTAEQINALGGDERKQLAIDWMDGNLGPQGWQEFEKQYAAEEKFYTENPEAASIAELRERAGEYPSGKEAFVRTLMENNPGYAEFMQEQFDSYPTNPDEALSKAFTVESYEALMGLSGSVYDAQPETAENGPRVPNRDGEIEQVDLAAANGARRQKQAQDRAAGSTFEQAIDADFATLGQLKAKLDAYDPSGGAWQAYLANVTLPVGQKRSRLPSGIYDIVKGSFQADDGKTYDYPMQGGYAAGYLAYVQTNPERVMAFEVWQKQERQKKEAAETAAGATGQAGVPSAVTDPATLVGGKSDPNYLPGAPSGNAVGAIWQTQGTLPGITVTRGGTGSTTGFLAGAQQAGTPATAQPAPAATAQPDFLAGAQPAQAPATATAAPAAPPPAPTPLPTAQPGGRTVTSNVNNLNLRAGPDPNAPVLRLLPIGAAMQVIGQQGNWVQVRFPDGSTGWVSSAYLDAAA
jgi:hypothetical protein